MIATCRCVAVTPCEICRDIDAVTEETAMQHPAHDPAQSVRSLWVVATCVLSEMLNDGLEAEVRAIIALLPAERLASNIAERDHHCRVVLPERRAREQADLEERNATAAAFRAETAARAARWQEQLDAGGREAIRDWLADLETGRRLPPLEESAEVMFAALNADDGRPDGLGTRPGDALAQYARRSAQVLANAAEAAEWGPDAPTTRAGWFEALDSYRPTPNIVRIVGPSAAMELLIKNAEGPVSDAELAALGVR